MDGDILAGLKDWLKQLRPDRRGGPLPRYSPEVGKSLREYTDFYLSKNTILGSHSEDFQRKLKEQMYGSVAEVFAADNPFLQCRGKLAEYVANFADWNVLCLKPDEMVQLEKGDVRLSPYISGELYRHILDCAQANDELAAFIARNKSCSDDYLDGWARARSCAYMYLMNCMNMVRADVNDCPIADKTDWFQPFVKSMLISAEDTYRRTIGLPSLFPEPVEFAWRHSSFVTCVLNGARDPLSHWESAHELNHADVS